MDLTNDDFCFGCGEKNPHGLHLSFEYSDEGDEAWTYFVPEKSHEGWEGIVHGGIIAVVMDETAAKLASRMVIRGVTGRLDVRYVKPALVGQRLEFRGRLLRQRGRIVEVAVEARRDDGTLVATCLAVIYRVQ
ncbi:MAG: PaaI family thioesterase [Candidatus Coatesbacteria bacterium]|nr:MAG: PaaI family thioesterase [Candidatus Coatesbacteria bacterium]